MAALVSTFALNTTLYVLPSSAFNSATKKKKNLVFQKLVGIWHYSLHYIKLVKPSGYFTYTLL